MLRNRSPILWSILSALTMAVFGLVLALRLEGAKQA